MGSWGLYEREDALRRRRLGLILDGSDGMELKTLLKNPTCHGTS
jgi:hypothetical protein